MAAYRRTCRALPIVALAVALIGRVGSSSTLAATPSYSEDEIEAAFLYRFAGFVKWPAQTRASSAFTVAVLDDDAVADDLERMLAHNDLNGARAQVRRITDIEQLGDARILYIGESDESRLKRWLALIAGRPVLVVTSQPGGLDDGSTINFIVIDRHVRFEISLIAARRAGLNISAELLSVATHVEGRPIGSEAPCEMAAPGPRPGIACAPRLAAK
jgi:YfiR/HmsC-like